MSFQVSKSAFTLVELLVTITIIGLLAGLVAPALAKAKQGARRAECLGQTKQWGVAFLSYAADNNDVLPREGYHTNGEVYWNNWAQVQHPVAKDVWYNVLGDYVSRPPASAYAAPGGRAPFYQRGSFFQCPSARFPKAAESPGYQIALFSLAMNSQLIDPPNVPTVRLDSIRRPSHTVLMLDNLLENDVPVVNEQAKDNLGQPAAYANRFAGRRHGSAGNIGFSDGRVESIRGERAVETHGANRGWAILPATEILWEVEGDQ
jgi:prepilin-type N-terminal cleavage/methylation domain-containing protein/prepilin-type processing-associated H-X9-DG protein